MGINLTFEGLNSFIFFAHFLFLFFAVFTFSVQLNGVHSFLYHYIAQTLRGIKLNTQESPYGDRGSTVVKVLCYKSEGRWFDSR